MHVAIENNDYNIDIMSILINIKIIFHKILMPKAIALQ